MRFAFLITARCNASCAHCTVDSGPARTESLPDPALLDLMDEAAALWRRERSAGEPLDFALSGGEPFLDFPRLLHVVEHGARLGARVAVVTNGSWATSDSKARMRVAALKRAGVSMLAVSTSRFHARFVDRVRLERAIASARACGVRTSLKCAYTAADPDLMEWARAQGVDQLEMFPVMPYGRDGASLAEHPLIRYPGVPEGRCPGPMLTIREDGRAYTCCMPGAFTPFHGLGNVLESGLEAAYERFYLGGVQQALRAAGPAFFARAVQRAGQGHLLRDEYESVCDLCAHIAGDARMAPVARRAAEKLGRARFRGALWRAATGTLARAVAALRNSPQP